MDMQNMLSEIRGALGNMQFPAQKNDIVSHAQSQGVGSDVKGLLEKLPEQNFGSIEEVLQKLPLGTLAEDAKKFL